MYYALEVFNLNEYFVKNLEDQEFLDMVDDIDFYQDQDKEVTYRKDEVVIKNVLYSTYYFEDDEKREEKINEIKNKNQKLFRVISASSQSNEPDNES